MKQYRILSELIDVCLIDIDYEAFDLALKLNVTVIFDSKAKMLPLLEHEDAPEYINEIKSLIIHDLYGEELLVALYMKELPKEKVLAVDLVDLDISQRIRVLKDIEKSLLNEFYFSSDDPGYAGDEYVKADIPDLQSLSFMLSFHKMAYAANMKIFDYATNGGRFDLSDEALTAEISELFANNLDLEIATRWEAATQLLLFYRAPTLEAFLTSLSFNPISAP